MNEDDEENDDSESKLEPTHYSKLDVKKMKVDELRTELMARDLDTRGLKNQLISRLKDALDSEKVNFFLFFLLFYFFHFLYFYNRKKMKIKVIMKKT